MLRARQKIDPKAGSSVRPQRRYGIKGTQACQSRTMSDEVDGEAFGHGRKRSDRRAFFFRSSEMLSAPFRIARIKTFVHGFSRDMENLI